MGMETGEVEMAMHGLVIHDMGVFLTASRSLDTLVKGMETNVHRMREFKQEMFAHFNVLCWQTALNLNGQSADPLIMTGKAMNQDEMINLALEKKSVVMEAMMYSFRMLLAYLFGDLANAAMYAEKSKDFGKSRPYACVGMSNFKNCAS